MLVSAYWHGVHPGYYLSFLTIPVNLLAEDLCIAAFRKDASARKQKIFDWACWFMKMRTFEYMSMGFLLLTYFDTMRYWQSIYFIPHILIGMFIIIGLVNKPKRKREHDKNETKPVKTDVTLGNDVVGSGDTVHIKQQ